MKVPGLGKAIRAWRATSRYAQVSYAQEGEDLILADLFSRRGPGFYVDVGAFHPLRFSNTYLLHKSGWRGINIDPTPGSMRAFRLLRRHDIDLEVGVTETRTELPFSLFEEPALNTFDPAQTAMHTAAGRRPIRTVQIQCLPLREILAEHAGGHAIDFMSLDVEGHEMEVLRSNDWDRWRPEALLVEMLRTPMEEIPATPAGMLLRDLGYRPVAKTVRSVLFTR